MTNQTQTHKAPLIAVISIVWFQVLFYLIPAIIGYWLVTLNYLMLAICVGISVVQRIVVRGRNQTYVRFIGKYLKVGEYSHIHRIYQQEVKDQNQQRTLFCYHPHSVFGYGIMMNANHPRYANEKLSRGVVIGSNFVLNVPIIGGHLRMWGIDGADSYTFKSLMEKGRTVCLLPGGYQEATLTTPKEWRVYIKNRKGFIKYALKYNYTIRQVLVMNEHKAMWTLDKFLPFRLMLNTIKIPGVIYWGKWGLLYPTGIKMTTVIGKGMTGRKYAENQEPTQEEVERFHEEYVRNLVDFYERHKSLNEMTQIRLY